MLRDREVTVNTDQEPPCHVTEKSDKKANYETITGDVTSRAPSPRQSAPPSQPPPFVSFQTLFLLPPVRPYFEIVSQLIHVLFTSYLTPTSLYKPLSWPNSPVQSHHSTPLSSCHLCEDLCPHFGCVKRSVCEALSV